MTRRVFAISDLHVDYETNWAWLERISASGYAGDALLVAGDISHNLDRLERALALLCERFGMVFFVPGNHDLWLRKGAEKDSLEKLEQILARCRALGVRTSPEKVGGGVWVVPLFSWYATPSGGDDSLFVPKPGRDLTERMWSDRAYIRWPGGLGEMAAHFFEKNNPALGRDYDAPVISFSHFLPRRELIFPQGATIPPPPSPWVEKYPVNFSRVAGSRVLESQLRRLGSSVHVYGHQHRNRDRTIEGVRYVSYCLGYPNERARGQVVVEEHQPKQIWPPTRDGA